MSSSLLSNLFVCCQAGVLQAKLAKKEKKKKKKDKKLEDAETEHVNGDSTLGERMLFFGSLPTRKSNNNRVVPCWVPKRR